MTDDRNELDTLAVPPRAPHPREVLRELQQRMAHSVPDIVRLLERIIADKEQQCRRQSGASRNRTLDEIAGLYLLIEEVKSRYMYR